MTLTGLQTSLFGAGEPSFDPTFAGIERTELADGAWIERLPGWLAGEQTVYDEVTESTTWHAARRPMYDRIVDVPRLTATAPADGAPPPVLVDAAEALCTRFDQPCRLISYAWYRDGRDSVAPHGDTIGRAMPTTVMATVSCGAPRRFLLSPVGAGESVSFDLGHGDLLVMGGTIQRTWRHGIPKTSRPTGPRLCIMFRPPWLG